MEKKELREAAKKDLLEMDEKTSFSLNQRIVKHLFQSHLWKNASTVGVTISHGFEWDTDPIIHQGWKEGKRIVVPKCLPVSKELLFYQLDSYNQLEVVYYQLREPNPKYSQRIAKEKIDLLIVPGILFDKKGYRIGFGGGYYDRFLKDFSNDTVSICYSGQLVNEVPRECFDIAVQTIITENGLLQTR